ncbi:dnaJ homolog subfamily C member 14 [Anguilla rostrata]|uniref:dnaJ homolog subfamily C member 14 n=1 Tax=Anguilla rostrata TaxID=7938 RepID=UPI0030D05147
MDKPGDAGQEPPKSTPVPQSCGCGGSAVGNGVCHGQPRPRVADPAPLLKTGDEAEDGVGRWAAPTVGVETCGALKEDRQGEQEEEDDSPGREEQEVGEAEPHLKELFDAGLRKMVNESGFSPTSSPSGFLSGDGRGRGQGEETEAWRLSGEGEAAEDVEPPSLFPGDPFLEEEEGGPEAGRPGHDRSEDRDGDEEEEEEEEEGADEDRDGRSEDGRDWRAGGDLGPRRPSGGKRGKGRGEPAPAAPSKAPLSAGGRHKQARRRNHHHHHHQGRARGGAGSRAAAACRELLAGSLRPWCLSCLRMVVELIVLVAHRCGEAVEAGGAALYASGSALLRRAHDLPVLKAQAGRLLGGAGRLGRRATASCLAGLSRAALLGGAWAGGALGRLGGERGHRCWAAFRDSRACKAAAALWEKVAGAFRGRGQRASPGGAGRAPPGQELERLLELAQIPEDQLDPFAVLGVEASASDTELKRAYRQLAVQVHPDKNKHPRAGEAFKVLRAAWDVVSNPETRREYELKRMAETELSRSMNEFLSKLQDDLKEAMNTMMCTKCEGKHKRFEMERDPSEARFCAECNKRHGAEEGDFWAESSLLGLRITYFAFMDGKVYDITEWAGCQRIGISPDTHRVPYHISFGSKNSSGSATRHRTPSEPPPGPSSPADLQDFFNRIFHGGAPNGMAANGGFFPPGAPPHPPPRPGPGPGPGGPFSAPPPHTGFFGPGGQRADPPEPRTEGPKPPRRRKKVRKPFQR